MFQVTSADIAATQTRLAQLSERFDDLSPLMAYVAALMDDVAQRSFATESDPSGGLWPPLTEATANRKVTAAGARRGYHPILQVTGALAALTTGSDTNSAWIGSNLIQSALLFFGGRGVPARPYFGLSPQNLSSIELAAVRFFSGEAL